MPEKKVEFNIDDLEIVDAEPDYLKISNQEIIDKIKELKQAGNLEGGVGIGVVW